MKTKEQAQAALDEFNAYVDANVPCGLSARLIKLMHKEALEAMSGDGWMPIETAPKDGQIIFCFFPIGKGKRLYGNTRMVNFSYDTWRIYPGQSPIHTKPTHWMPLPPAPKGKDNENL